MLGSATLTIVVSRLMASTAAQTVSRTGSLDRIAFSSDEHVDSDNITVPRNVTTVNINAYDEPVPSAAKPYHHGNLRAALVDAGAELARAQGPDGVVLREVARRTGVSHNAAYRHFADRDELLAEIASLANDQLEQAMQRRLDDVTETDPAKRARARLRATGRAYVEFALVRAGLFNVAFCPTDAGRERPRGGRALRPARSGARRARRDRRPLPRRPAGRRRRLLVGRARPVGAPARRRAPRPERRGARGACWRS